MIKGIVKDKFNSVLADVDVMLKDSCFQTVSSTKTDRSGKFVLEINGGVYPYLAAVKDYGTKFLEYWCRNLDTSNEIDLNITIDKLEIYGINAFVVGGGYDSVMVYFRPMSLVKFLKGETDIAPDLKKIQSSIDGVPAEILECNPVQESIGEGALKAYLLQLRKTDETCTKDWESIEIRIFDEDGNTGMAKLYR